MKHNLILLSYACCLLYLSAFSAVPLRWTVETSRATPAQFEAYQGETLALEAALQSYGKPLEAPSNYSFFWQTNGMGNVYWSTNVSNVSNLSNPSNLLRATWTPYMETGAKVYNCFIGVPGTIYHAAFQLRLRPSPGAIPNVLPLPVPVIDFAKVRVLNPPWPTGGTDTNAVIDIIHETVDGAARPLPKYLHTYDADDSYPDAAQEYYRSRGDGKVDGGCSAVRSGGYLSRNFDFPFDERSEFVVRMSASTKRFASVGVAQVGTNLTEAIVTSGKPSRCYKWLPGATVDGINENGVVAEINVVDGDPATSGWHTGGDIHPLAAVRWALDNGTSAAMVATNLAARIAFPAGWSQNFHYMIADETSTYIVENGSAHAVTNGVPVMTNFRLYPTRDTAGAGQERYDLLLSSACCITNAWYTRAYLRSTDWASEFHDAAEMEAAKAAWETHTREQLRGHGLWQSVHTSIYDLTNRTLRISVQETDDWYTFAVPVSSSIKVETDPTVPAWAKAANPPEGMTDNALVLTNGAVKTKGGNAVTDATLSITNMPADAKATGDAVNEIVLRNSQHKDDEYVGVDIKVIFSPLRAGSFERSVLNRNEYYPISQSVIDIATNAIHHYTQGELVFAIAVYTASRELESQFSSEILTVEWTCKGVIDGVRSEMEGALEISRINTYSLSCLCHCYRKSLDGSHYKVELSQNMREFTTEREIVFDDLALKENISATDPTFSSAVVEVTTNMIRREVSSALNTYIDGETGVEYVGRFYGGSLYYVPTGNVYPPNN